MRPSLSTMKKLSVAIVIFLFVLTCKGQELYSQKNLEQASSEDLSLYLTKAQKLKKAGAVVSIAGASTVILGIILMAAGESTAYVGIGMSFVGLCGTVIGIPILATGLSRVKRTSKVWNAKFNKAFIEISPGSFVDYQTHNIQPGLTLRIRF